MPVFAQSSSFWNETFTLQGGDLCYSKGMYAYDSSGSTVVGTITVTQGKADFFILTQAQYADSFGGPSSKRSATCAVFRPLHDEQGVMGITGTYNVNFLMPDSANHYFIVFNPYIYDTTVTVSLNWSS